MPTRQGYTADFGAVKGNLTTVQRAWYDVDKQLIGSWDSNVASELPSGSGVYAISETAPTNAYWLAWSTGEATPRYLFTPVVYNAYVFNFGNPNTGKSVGYTYLNADFVALSSEITAGITEFGSDGLFWAQNGDPPVGAYFIRARTIEASPEYLGFSVDRTGAIAAVTSAKITHRDDKLEIINSIGYYIMNKQFFYGSDLTSISQRYSNFSVGIGWPESFEVITPPHVAVDIIGTRSRKTGTWNKSIKEYDVRVYGFIGRKDGGEANKKELYQIMDDIENIFDEQKGGQNVIDLIDFMVGSSGTILGSLGISELSSLPLITEGSDILDLMRYRFEIEFIASLWKSQ